MVPRYAPFYSEADARWHVAPYCDWIPLVSHDGVIMGCLGIRATH